MRKLTTFADATWLLRALLLMLALASTGVITLVPATAQAQSATDKRKAGEHFGRGKELFDEGDFAGALVEFERAYQLAPNWRVLFNIGQVKYQLQDYPGAMESLEGYLSEGGSEIPADRRATVQADVERLRARVAYVRINVNEAGATVTVDDRKVGISPLATSVAVSAGRRKITATADGAAPVTKFLDLAGGDNSEVTLDILRTETAVPVPTPVPGPNGGDEGVNVPWAAWGVTAAFGVGALAFGLVALNAASDFDDKKAAATSLDELESSRDQVLGFAITTDVLLGATVVMAAISIYLTVDAATSTGDDKKPETTLRLRLSPTGLGLAGTF